MSAHHARQRLDLGRARRAAALADVLVLLAVEQHEEEALADRHRLAAAGAVEQARLERAVALGRARAARGAATEQAGMVSPERGPPQRRARPTGSSSAAALGRSTHTHRGCPRAPAPL